MLRKIFFGVAVLTVFLAGSFAEFFFNITPYVKAFFRTSKLLAGDLYNKQLAGQAGDVNIIAVLVAVGGLLALLSFKYLAGSKRM